MLSELLDHLFSDVFDTLEGILGFIILGIFLLVFLIIFAFWGFLIRVIMKFAKPQPVETFFRNKAKMLKRAIGKRKKLQKWQSATELIAQRDSVSHTSGLRALQYYSYILSSSGEKLIAIHKRQQQMGNAGQVCVASTEFIIYLETQGDYPRRKILVEYDGESLGYIMPPKSEIYNANKQLIGNTQRPLNPNDLEEPFYQIALNGREIATMGIAYDYSQNVHHSYMPDVPLLELKDSVGLTSEEEKWLTVLTVCEIAFFRDSDW